MLTTNYDLKSFTAIISLAVISFVIFPGCEKNTKAQTSQSPASNIIKTTSGIEMVLINAGQFEMGSAAGKDSPKHLVKISSFYMDRNEVTQKSFAKLMGFNPAKFSNENSPIERVRWTEAVKYCNARSKAENLNPCYNEKTWDCDFSADGYRLPTEAEWEYACRAGTQTERFFDGPDSRLDRFAWYRKNSKDKTHPVKQKKANPWGLYDMYGNVAEWCNDYYSPNYYSTSPQDNPKGPSNGTQRVIRGGSWQSRGKYLTSHHRKKDNPALPDICQGYPIYGFRCVRRAR